MARWVRIGDEDDALEQLAPVARALSEARRVVALTGAGISVPSGIPDFRSADGLWTRFNPMDYATLSCFLREPERAWRLYRALGETLVGREPNEAHRALALLEGAGLLAGVVTQNVDRLHQAAGSRTVIEMHGEHSRLQCIGCGHLEPFLPAHLEPGPVPACPECGRPTKPNVVLFEERVRGLAEVDDLLTRCDVLVVAGTSATVAPASLLPSQVLARGGSIVELNREPTELTESGLGPSGVHVQGEIDVTLPALARRVLE